MPPYANGTNLTEVFLSMLKDKAYNLTIVLTESDVAPSNNGGTGLAGYVAELLTKAVLGGMEDMVPLDKLIIYVGRAGGFVYLGHQAWRRLPVDRRNMLVSSFGKAGEILGTKIGKAVRVVKKYVGLCGDAEDVFSDTQSTPTVDIEMGIGVGSSNTSSSAQRQGFYLQGGNPPIQVHVGRDGFVDITAQVLGPDDDEIEGSILEDSGEVDLLGSLASCFSGEV